MQNIKLFSVAANTRKILLQTSILLITQVLLKQVQIEACFYVVSCLSIVCGLNLI